MTDLGTSVTVSSRLGRMFCPRSIAVVGASPKRGTARNTIVRVLQRHGFDGAIYPVSPSSPEVEGLQAYPSVAALPVVPDLALVITPAHTVPGVIDECGAKGITSAIVYTSGFEEIASGKEVARELAAAAVRNSVAVLGPNCQGLWAVNARTILTFSNNALNLGALKSAPIAVVSQSGALGGAIASYLQKNGIGCSYMVSVGNETCLDLIDVLQWLVEQEDVRVIGLYVEGLHDAGRLVQVARRASARGIQIVALKAGRSAMGQKATASHTGKIASSHAVYADVFEQAGVIAVHNLAEILTALEVLGAMPNPRLSSDPRGGVSLLTSSGGAGALLADHSEELGIRMSEFQSGTVAALHGILPEFASKENPVDLTGQIYAVPNLFRNACTVIGDDQRTEAMIVQFAGSGLRNVQDDGDAFKEVARRTGMPMILSFVAELPDRETRQSFRDSSILFTDDTMSAMRALSWLYQRQRYAARPSAAANPALPARKAPLGWAETMGFCEAAGLSPAKWAVLASGQTAASACADMTYPLVVKVLPEDCEHKTELGLVKLRVRTPEEVDALATEFRTKMGKPAAGVLVQEMVDGGVEVVLSCLRNTDFGAVLSLGSGGVAIELYRDVVHLSLPTTEAQVIEALGRLKLNILLNGFRGAPAADVAALARAAVRFGDMFLATPEVTEFEINPLFVRSQGRGLLVVDALMNTSSEPAPAAGPAR